MVPKQVKIFTTKPFRLILRMLQYMVENPGAAIFSSLLMLFLPKNKDLKKPPHYLKKAKKKFSHSIS